jgi:CheY-like chemotaxis protein
VFSCPGFWRLSNTAAETRVRIALVAEGISIQEMDQPSLSEFEKFLGDDLRLPVLPRALLRLLDDKRAFRVRLLEAAGCDPVVTTVLLRAANSPSIRAPERADSMSGADLVDRDLISAALLSVRTHRPGAGHRFSLTSFRRHSIGCAVISELLAKRMSYPAPADAFLAGLLHDLGKVVLAAWKPAVYDAALEESQAARIAVLPIEERRIGIGHTLAGALLMKQWNFPAFLQGVTSLHHQEFSNPAKEKGTEVLAVIIQHANRLCHLWGFGGDVPQDEPKLVELAEHTRLSAEDFCELFIEASDRIRQLDSVADGRDEATEEAALDALLNRLAKLYLTALTKNRDFEPAAFLTNGLRMERGFSADRTISHTKPVSAPEPRDCLRGLDAGRVERIATRCSGTVLVAEDDQALRQLLIEVLRRAGYEAEGAQDGLEAIRKLIDVPYLAAILDLQMPRIDGLEVLVTARRIAPDMPIVVLTGLVGLDGAEAAREAGAFRYLRKPVSNQEILNALADAVASRADNAERATKAAG